MFEQWLEAFLKTLIVEAPIIFYLLRALSLRVVFFGFVIANGISHPLLWYVFPRFSPYPLWLLCAEVAVMFVEFIVYKGIFWRKASLGKIFLASVVANTASCLIGLLM
jgi:hypothetical protein